MKYMGIIGVLFDIAFHLFKAVIELIVGAIGVIIRYFWFPILIIITIWFINVYIKGKRLKTGEPHEIKFEDGAVIGYASKPPNFKKAFFDETGMRHSCGTCTHCGDSRSEEVVCKKYGVKYKGHGCLDKTVCDDYNSILFDA